MKGSEHSASPREGLTAEALKEHRKAICRELESRLEGWRASGFSFAGRSPEIHAEIELKKSGARPSEKDLWIPLPDALGGTLKVFIRRIRVAQGPIAPNFSDGGYRFVTEPLAPGAPILVPSSSGMNRGGIAAFVCLNGVPHLLTCAHIFEGPAEIFVDPRGKAIATLRRAYLDDVDPLDAAVCELTCDGLDLCSQSTSAETWFTSYREPDPSDNGINAVFFPTSSGNDGPYEVDIASYWASTSILFRSGRQDGLIETQVPVIGGDSGSALILGESYYGLCSGEVAGQTSFFTPIASALERLVREYREVSLWAP